MPQFSSQTQNPLELDKGIAENYWLAYGKQKRILHLLDHKPDQYRHLILEQPQHPLTRLGLAIQQLRTERCGLVLGFGNVYLKRTDFQNMPFPMEDIFSTPLIE